MTADGSSRRTALWLVLIAAAAVLVALLLPAALAARLSAGLRADLRAQSAHVALRGGPGALLSGRFSRMTVDVRGGVVDSVPLESLQADLSDLMLDRRAAVGGRLAFSAIGGGGATLALNERHLETYLAGKGLTGARVSLVAGVVSVTGRVRILTYEVDVLMRGRLAADGSRVTLRIDTLSVGGVALPPQVADALTAPLNPLLTAQQLPLPLRLTGVTVGEGRLVVRAVAMP